MGKRAERRARTKARLDEIKQHFRATLREGLEKTWSWDRMMDEMSNKLVSLGKATPKQEQHMLCRAFREMGSTGISEELDKITSERLAKGGQA